MKTYEELDELQRDEVMRDIDIMTEEDVESLFDDMLDECYESVTISGIEFLPSSILATDETAYRCGLND